MSNPIGYLCSYYDEAAHTNINHTVKSPQKLFYGVYTTIMTIITSPFIIYKPIYPGDKR